VRAIIDACFTKAQQVRTHAREKNKSDLSARLDDYSIITPTLPSTAFPFGEEVKGFP
jgi:hypothetical protein